MLMIDRFPPRFTDVDRRAFFAYAHDQTSRLDAIGDAARRLFDGEMPGGDEPEVLDILLWEYAETATPRRPPAGTYGCAASSTQRHTVQVLGGLWDGLEVVTSNTDRESITIDDEGREVQDLAP